MLPLAMPAYLVAYLYTDLFDYAGPVQRFLREMFDWHSPNDYWFFDVRSLVGAAVILSFVLFPYVYMLARTAFETQDPSFQRASRSLGNSAKQTFYKVSLPLARPAIAIAASLVLMETLADFATVQYFAVNTLTTAIYDTWLGYGDLATANALASVLMLLVLIAVVAEYKARAGQRHQSHSSNSEQPLISLSPIQQLFALLFCWSLVTIGFLLPFGLLISMAIEYSDSSQLTKLFDIGMNSVEVAVYAATCATVLALSLNLYRRLSKHRLKHYPQMITGFGYAIPGTVLAMAMLATLAPADHIINDIAEGLSFSPPGLILSGSIFAVVFAFVVRFSAIANGTIESGLTRIPDSLDKAPSSLGVGIMGMIRKIHIPLLKPSILVAWLLVFVEAMKELPAVLLLRPFNFETLSTYIYQLITDEQLEQGAIGAILIVLFGLLPIIWLNKGKQNS